MSSLRAAVLVGSLITRSAAFVNSSVSTKYFPLRAYPAGSNNHEGATAAGPAQEMPSGTVVGPREKKLRTSEQDFRRCCRVPHLAAFYVLRDHGECAAYNAGKASGRSLRRHSLEFVSVHAPQPHPLALNANLRAARSMFQEMLSLQHRDKLLRR